MKTKFIWHKFMKNLTPDLTLDLERPQHTVFLWRFLKVSKFRKQITVKLDDKERFYKEQIGVKEPFPVTICQFTS